MNRPSSKQMALDLDQPSDPIPINLTTPELLDVLDEWVAAGWLRPVDCAVARMVLHPVPDVPPLALLALVLASHQAGQGHVCLDMSACLVDAESTLRIPSGEGRTKNHFTAPRTTPADLLRGVTLSAWQAALDACPEVILPDPESSMPESSIFTSSVSGPSISGAPISEQSNPPFVREEGQIYLRRYWQQEEGIVTALRSRLSPRDLPAEPIRALLDRLFSPAPIAPDWQKVACAMAVRSRFALITGGPGTGKTTTVVKFLMLVQMQALKAGLPPRRIRLCAPTGKAAARLRQSMLGQIDTLLAPFAAAFPELRAALPDTVDTVHRLIGVRPNQIHPVYRPENPLPADVVVVDEASMIGVELMAKLLAALDDSTQLVLLGDKDQLASVEPGAVLGELSSVLRPDAYTSQTREWVAAATGQALPVAESSGSECAEKSALAQAAVQLQHSYRFDSVSDIGTLARSVNAGDVAAALSLLRANGQEASVRLVADDSGHQPLRSIVLESLSPWLAALGEPMSADNRDERAQAIFAAHQRAQVLCALRHGPYGVTGLNRWIEDMLRRVGALAVTGEWYVGRPVMVTRNDFGLRLANGDLGITLPYVDSNSPQSQPTLRVAFPNDIAQAGESPIRWIAPARLTACETAFALTVHKAQGSEFDHSVLVLPATPNPVLTRELIYTAITRARQRFTLVTAATDTTFNVLKQGISRRVQRSGQLGAKLARPVAVSQGLGD